MIQHVTVDHNTHDAITQAARDAGLAYDHMLSWIVADWATTYRKRNNAAPAHDTHGVIPGGD